MPRLVMTSWSTALLLLLVALDAAVVGSTRPVDTADEFAHTPAVPMLLMDDGDLPHGFFTAAHFTTTTQRSI